MLFDAVRTAVGKRGGGFAHEHPADMAAHVIRAVVDRRDLDPEAVDDVLLGCLDNIGSQAAAKMTEPRESVASAADLVEDAAHPDHID